MSKKGYSFSNIIAIIGAVLICLGIAWLLAQNWNSINDAAKIIILASITAAAYFSGTFLRLKKYKGIARSLFLLGSIIYTLSVFLIAQIFSTSTTLQGTAMLFMLSFTGVVCAAYIFMSPESLIAGMVEFMIWFFLQFAAFVEGSKLEPSFGLLALCLLFIGIMFFGLSAIHRAKNMIFSRLYRWCTCFYFLMFGYILSFQMILPLLWSSESDYLGSAIVFLLVTATISVIILSVGLRANKIKKKELLGFATIVVMLFSLIGLSYFTHDTIGACDIKYCYDFRTDTECMDNNLGLECNWDMNYCREKNCYDIKEEEECKRFIGENEKFGSNDCQWIDGRCMLKECYQYRDKESCLQNSCSWNNNNCEIVSCYSLITEEECNSEEDQIKCEWNSNLRFGSCNPINSCDDYTNNYERCSSNDKCKWRAANSNSFWRDGKGAPITAWAVWIIVNIALIGMIIAVISYGSWIKDNSIIYLGMAAFALFIITRYIGFMMDLWGYTSLSVIFIVGGIVLIGSALGFERWRKKLILKKGR